MTIGGAAAGVSVRFVSDVISTPNLLLSVVLLDAILIIQLMLLEWIGKPNDRSLSKSEYLSLSSIKSVAGLMVKFPIILLLAVGMMLSVLLWGMSELQFFSIYSQSFPDQAELTGFLGLMSASANLLEFSITYFVTRPLIRIWGVRWMNLVYPLTTLLSFVGLSAYFQLTSAIVVNLNYDSTLPPYLSSKIRLMIDGLLYPLCQAATGAILMAQQATLTSLQISVGGVALSAVFLWVGYLTGKSYRRVESHV
jgi:ATP/ADP translocase